MSSIRALICLGCCAALSCSGAPQQAAKPGKPPSQLQAVARAALSAEADRGRQQLVKEELDKLTDHELAFSAGAMPEQEHHLLGTLLQAAALVDELHLLQVAPQNLKYRDTVQSDGTADDKRLFDRNHGPWCNSTQDVRCSTLRSMPPRPVGSAAWPEKMTLDDLQKMRASPESKALLSPFTVVRRKGAGYQAQPLSADPLLGPRVQRLAELLRQAAGFAAESGLKTLLTAQADALLSKDPYPFTGADQLWLELTGHVEVAVGPYDTSGDPWGIKARFLLHLGLEDEAVTAHLTDLGKARPNLERRLGKLVGKAVYTPSPKEAPQVVVRAVRLIRSAGARPDGASDAYQLAVSSKGAPERLKHVLLTNVLRARWPQIQQQASLVLSPDLQPLVTEEAYLANATVRAFALQLGGRSDREIATAKGRSTPQKALGELAPVFAELKTDALTLWTSTERRWGKKVTGQQLKERFATLLVQLLDVARADLAGSPRAQASALLLGQLIKLKAIQYDEASGRWSIKFGVMRRGVKGLTKELASIWLGGQRATADKLYSGYIKREGAVVRLGDLVDRPRLRAKETFMRAGLKPLALSYKVTDLKPLPAVNLAQPGKPAAAPAAPAPGKPAAAPAPAPAKPMTAKEKKAAERKAKIEAAKAKREEAKAKREEAKAKKAAERKAKIEAAKAKREEAKAKREEAKAKKAAERKAKIEAAKKKRDEAKAKRDEAKAKKEAERKAKIEAAKKKRDEAKAKRDEAKAKKEAERKAKIEAAKKKRGEAKAKKEAERKAKQEAAKKKREEAKAKKDAKKANKDAKKDAKKANKDAKKANKNAKKANKNAKKAKKAKKAK